MWFGKLQVWFFKPFIDNFASLLNNMTVSLAYAWTEALSSICSRRLEPDCCCLLRSLSWSNTEFFVVVFFFALALDRYSPLLCFIITVWLFVFYYEVACSKVETLCRPNVFVSELARSWPSKTSLNTILFLKVFCCIGNTLTWLE